MLKRSGFIPVLLFAAILALPGCTRVRTYVVEKDRVDQDLTTGNAGYLMGTPKESDIPKDRKLTRQTYVTEIELGGVPKRAKKTTGSGETMKVEASQEPPNQVVIEKPIETAVATAGKSSSVTSYTVQNNDNLEKISKKVYGTSKNWKKIYEANRDQLKNPDRIYAGMVLKIPQE